MAISIEEKLARGERLRAARIKKGINTQAEACRRYNWNVKTYRFHESGERGYDETAKEYASTYNVSAGWLMYGENPPKWYKDKNYKAGVFDVPEMAYIKAPIIDCAQLLKLSRDSTAPNILPRSSRYIFINPKRNPEYSSKFISLDISESDEKNSPLLNPGDTVTIDLELAAKPGKLAVAILKNECIVGRFVKKNKGNYLSFENKSAYPDNLPVKDVSKIFRVISKTVQE